MLTGINLIGNEASAKGTQSFQAVNPHTGELLAPMYVEATQEEVDQAVSAASEAFEIYRRTSPEKKAQFLEQIGEEIMALGDTLLERTMEETALPKARLQGERGRTVNQLRLFAKVVREGSWVQARIDTAIPDRSPIPKPDLRSMNIPLGPVGIFGASNFPYAFSVAGGDTASALAAGCTVVVKAHPAHPGTSEFMGKAIQQALKKSDLPAGVFSLVQGPSVDVGMAIVQHPLIKAIGFTGSFRGGKAIFDAAMKRPEPIPVYAEMGSTNPVFILPDALASKKQEIAQGLAKSVALGVGQFCTNPGLVVGLAGNALDDFTTAAASAISEVSGGTMLTKKISDAYQHGLKRLISYEDIEILASGNSINSHSPGQAHILKTNAEIINTQNEVSEEVFGPSTILISAENDWELEQLAQQLSGHLTATIHATEEDLSTYSELVQILTSKVGRLILNGYPTGVEVCDSMVHGGPFPATTDSRTTSVGTMAIHRFARPIAFQSFPEAWLPKELHDSNPLKIWRLVNGEYTKASDHV